MKILTLPTTFQAIDRVSKACIKGSQKSQLCVMELIGPLATSESSPGNAKRGNNCVARGTKFLVMFAVHIQFV